MCFQSGAGGEANTVDVSIPKDVCVIMHCCSYSWQFHRIC